MTQLIHSSPLGALEIPGIGIVDPGEAFEVEPGHAKILLEQDELYALADPEGFWALKVPELLALAAERGIEQPGKKKADIIAALEAHDISKGASE